MATQTGSIDLAATNGVHLYAKAGFENAEETYATQADLDIQADRIGMVVANSDASSSLQLTADAMSYIGNHVVITGTDGTTTIISGGHLDVSTLTIGQDQVENLDETLQDLVPTNLGAFENDVGYVDATFVPDEVPVANIVGQLTVDKIDVDSLRAALLQAASLLIGQDDATHIQASGNRMSFMNGEQEVAYIDIDENDDAVFYMTRSIVVKDMQFGDGKWKWYKRDNNNMSLKWLGGM